MSIPNMGDPNGVNAYETNYHLDIKPIDVNFGVGQTQVYDPIYWEEKKLASQEAAEAKHQTYSNMAGAFGSATGIIGAVMDYNRKASASARNIAEAKQQHALNQQKFGLNKQDAFLKFLQNKRNLQDAKTQSYLKMNGNLAEVNGMVNKEQQQLTGALRNINHQLLDGYNRMKVTDMSTIQGQLAMSSHQVEKAKAIAKDQKEAIASTRSRVEDQEDSSGDMIKLQEIESQKTIGLSMAEETDSYEHELSTIKRQLAEAKRQRNSAMLSGALSLVGTAVGTAFGGPMGGSLGASIGSGVGGLIGGSM